MLTEQEWSRNVGTPAFPVTFLHEYAVGLLWDRCKKYLDDHKDPVDVKMIDGKMSGPLMHGVHHVTIPDSLQSIGGWVPDLALLGKDLRPIRVIEVVVTSPPKEEKVNVLTKQGVEVIQVSVRNEEDLRGLCPDTVHNGVKWWHQLNMAENHRLGRRSLTREDQHNFDKEVEHLIANLIRCSPATRRRLVTVLAEITGLESLYPLRPDNPKRDVISRT